MDIDKELQKMEDEMKAHEKGVRDGRRARAASAEASARKSNPLLEFVVGFLLLGVSIYWILNSFEVRFVWGSIWTGMGISASMVTGLMLVPLLIGIGLAFFMKKKTIPGIVIALGILIILITLLTSVRFAPMRATLWQYVLMFGMFAAGAGLLAKSLFTKSE